MKGFLFLLTILVSTSAFAEKKCIRYRVKHNNPHNKQTLGYVHESGETYAQDNSQNLEQHFKGCLVAGPDGVVPVRYNPLKCICTKYFGIDEEELSNKIATKVAKMIGDRIQQDHQANTTAATSEVVELHGSLVMSLQNFVNDLLDLSSNKEKKND
jgi:hypothetical protein